MHLLALVAVVAIPIAMMVGAVGLQQLEQRLLGFPTQHDRSDEVEAPRRPMPDAEPATVPLLLPRVHGPEPTR